MLFYKFSAGQAVKSHALHLDRFLCWWYTKKGALVRPSHGEPCGYFIIFNYHFFQPPLNVRKGTAHHADDSKITSCATHWFGIARYIKYRLRVNEFRGQFFTGG